MIGSGGVGMNGGARTFDAPDVWRVLRQPGPEDDKYTRGVVQIGTGSATYPGAAVLGVAGALGSGPGMVRFTGTSRCEDMVVGRYPEVVLNIGGFRAAVIGSGWDPGRRDTATKVLSRAATQPGDTRPPVIVDAGALQHVPEWLEGEFGSIPLILTPHMGEARRLADLLSPSAGTPSDGEELAAFLAHKTGCITVLKSSTTWVACPDGVHSTFRSTCGWAATAGSGDVLAGVIGGVVAANLHTGSLLDCVSAAVWIHGTAATIAAQPGQPIRATQIAECVPGVIGQVVGHQGRGPSVQ